MLIIAYPHETAFFERAPFEYQLDREDGEDG